jgi:hypothetical protein
LDSVEVGGEDLVVDLAMEAEAEVVEVGVE